MWVWKAALQPVECQWCARIAASVGKGLTDRFNTDEMHFIVSWKAVENQREPFERVYATRFDAVFKSILHQAQGVLRTTESATSVSHSIRQVMPSQLRAVARQLYSEVGRDFGSNPPLANPAKGLKAINNPGEYDPFTDPRMTAWFESVIGRRITNMTNFTAEDINRIITDSFESGRSLQDTIAELEDTYALSSTRASAIARTETVGASNAGTYFSVLANMGTNLNKIWLATQDNRTRDTHEAANSQKVSIEDPFHVGGSQLLFPGDTSLGAHAREIVNCRCTIYFERKAGSAGRGVQAGAAVRGHVLGQYDSRRAELDTLKRDLSKLTDEQWHEVTYRNITNKPIDDELAARLKERIAILRDQIEGINKQLEGVLSSLYQESPAKLTPKYYGLLSDHIAQATRRKVEEALDFVAKLIGSQSEMSGRRIEFTIYNDRMRAFARHLDIHVSAKDSVSNIIHELGHVIENGDPRVQKLIKAFYRERTRDEKAVSLRKVTGMSYGRDERTKVDKWIEPYMGKYYSSGHTELLSMGLEMMYKDPVKFMRRDPEMFDLIIDILRGLK